MRKFESNLAYGLRTLLLVQQQMGDGQLEMPWLADKTGMTPWALLSLNDLGFISLVQPKLNSDYVSLFDGERENLEYRASARRVSDDEYQWALESIKKCYPADACLGQERYDRLKLEGEILVSVDFIKRLCRHDVLSSVAASRGISSSELKEMQKQSGFVAEAVTFTLKVDEAKAKAWLADYAKDFAADAVSNGRESFGYAKTRSDVLKCIGEKLDKGINPANVVVKSSEMWGEGESSIINGHLLETLLAMEAEGKLKITWLPDLHAMKQGGGHALATSGDFDFYLDSTRVDATALVVAPKAGKSSGGGDAKVLSLNFENIENDGVRFTYRGKKSKVHRAALQWVQTCAYLIRRKNDEGHKTTKFGDVWANILGIEESKPGFFRQKPNPDSNADRIRKSVIRHVKSINENLKGELVLGKSDVCKIADEHASITLLL